MGGLPFLSGAHVGESRAGVDEASHGRRLDFDISDLDHVQLDLVVVHGLVQREPLYDLGRVGLEGFVVTSNGKFPTVHAEAEGEFSFVGDLSVFEDVEDRLDAGTAGGAEAEDAVGLLGVEEVGFVCDAAELVSELVLFCRVEAEIESVFRPEPMIRTSFAIGLTKLTKRAIITGTVCIDITIQYPRRLRL